MSSGLTVAVAVLTSFLGGGLGAILSTALGARRTRQETWRNRMVQAADEFSSAVGRALPAIRDAYDPALDSEKAAELIRLVDRSHARLARVELLFGPTTKPADTARRTVGALRAAVRALDATPADSSRARDEMYKADAELRQFALEAHAEMTGTSAADGAGPRSGPQGPLYRMAKRFARRLENR